MFSLIKQAFNLVFTYKMECSGGKPAWRSKTVWANAVAMLAAVLSKYAGLEISAEDSLIILAMVNVILRLITKESTGFIEKQ